MKLKAIGLAALVAASAAACTNPSTPAGHEGYLTHDPIAFGERTYEGFQTGPASTGVTWRKYALNIDMRKNTYTEEYDILSQDNLNVKFRSHAIISLKPGSVKKIVEEFHGKEWYEHNVRRPYRSSVREAVHKRTAYLVKAERDIIGKEVFLDLKEKYKDTPIVVENIAIGNIGYPKIVKDEIELKIAAEARLEKMKTRTEVATKQATIMKTEADGIAKEQKKILETLTPEYVQWENYQAWDDLAKSSNTTFVFGPFGEKGSGLILNTDASK